MADSTLPTDLDAPPLGRPHPSHRRPTDFDRFRYGVCYYPEHWDAATRANDPARIAAAGMDVVRMAEFAWSVLEPRPGEFDFSLFDEAIGRMADAGVQTILGTPTATPPVWLLDRHPDMARVSATGQALVHGSRQHASHMHGGFREACKTVTRAMAEHWRDHPSVVGWQTDNEIHCHFSEDYSDSARAAFVDWCRREYGDIGRLNDAWGTGFWSQTYDDFGQVGLPKGDAPTHPNPAHRLAYFRFLSDAAARFQRDQVEILREVGTARTVDPRWFVFHNGTFAHLDYRGPFGRDLDVMGYDSYPMFHPPIGRGADHAFKLDRTRAISGNFVVPEQQAGAGGQTDYFLDQPLPGEMRQMAYRSIARGADALLFFRWRTARVGAEQYWLGLVDHDDVGRRRLDEATQLGGELARVGPAILGTSVVIDAAVASADVTVRDAHAACTLGLPDPDAVAATVHRSLASLGFAAGCVHPADDLSGLGVYVVPHWAWFDPAWAGPLRAFAEGGGLLVIGARTATRDTDNNVVAQAPPGVVADLAGVTVEEYGRVNAPEDRPHRLRVRGTDVRVTQWYESLAPAVGTDVLLTWHGGHLDGVPAATRRRVGRGSVVYVGTYLESAVCDALLPALCDSAERRVRPAGLAASVEHVVRAAPDGRRVEFFLNGGESPVTVDLPAGRDLIRDRPAGRRATLERFGVAAVEVR